MDYPIELPQVGESVTEAVIGKWLTKVGDHVEKYDLLVEVVTDKVNMDFPAPEAGTITEIIAEEGATVPMGAVIARMVPDDPNAKPPERDEGQKAGASARQDAAVDRIGQMVTGANVGPTGGTFADATATPSPASAAAQPRPETARRAGPAASVGDRSRRYSPVVLRLAEEREIDLSSLAGTGIGGRVTKRDVLSAMEPPAPATPVVPTEIAADRVFEPSPVRKIIAANMARSWAEIPHAWTTVEADVTGLVGLRAACKDDFEKRHGAPLTYVTFSVRAVAAALRSNPLANSSWENGKIRLKGSVNVGIAVATPDGLVVPVLHDAEQMSIAQLAAAIASLLERARESKLTLDDVRGGTFTLNNTGALGSVWGGAIINHPQAAILNTETIVRRPVVVAGPGGDAIAIRSIMNLCMSFDHRILDGAGASAFVHDVKRRLEEINPDTAVG